VECKNKADEQYMPLLLKDIDKIFKINMSRPVKKRKGNTGFFSLKWICYFFCCLIMLIHKYQNKYNCT